MGHFAGGWSSLRDALPAASPDFGNSMVALDGFACLEALCLVAFLRGTIDVAASPGVGSVAVGAVAMGFLGGWPLFFLAGAGSTLVVDESGPMVLVAATEHLPQVPTIVEG